MYRVIHQDRVVVSYYYFFDAWLHLYLELPEALIVGPDGYWSKACPYGMH